MKHVYNRTMTAFLGSESSRDLQLVPFLPHETRTKSDTHSRSQILEKSCVLEKNDVYWLASVGVFVMFAEEVEELVIVS